MNVQILKSECEAKIASGGEAMIVVLPRGVRLCGRYGPIGELLCVNAEGKSVVRFKATAILRYLKRAGV